jgi:hypothetical protein
VLAQKPWVGADGSLKAHSPGVWSNSCQRPEQQVKLVALPRNRRRSQPLAEAALLYATPGRHDLTIPCALDPGTELRPFSYRQSALCEQVAAPVSRLDLVLDRMCQGYLDHLARVDCSLSRPIAERGALSVDAKKLGIPARVRTSSCLIWAADVAEFVASGGYNGGGTSGFSGIAGLATKLAVRMKNMEPCRRGPRQKSSRAWPAMRVDDDLD